MLSLAIQKATMTYTQLKQSVVPYTISSLYSFGSGVALVTSLSTITSQFLIYFSITYTLSLITPLALLMGFVSCYYQHKEYHKKALELKLIKAQISEYEENNKIFARKLKGFFTRNSNLQDELHNMSAKFGELIYMNCSCKDTRSYIIIFLTTAMRFVLDAGLTIGVSIFVLTALTSIPFAGTTLILMVFAALIIAALSAYFIHFKNSYYTMQMNTYMKELDRQKNINKLYNEFKTSHTDISSCAESKDDTWWDEKHSASTLVKKMLATINIEVNKYLTEAGVIENLNRDPSNRYKITENSVTDLDKIIMTNANHKINYRSRNILLAVKISILIAHFVNHDNYHIPLLQIINLWRNEARDHSPWRFFRCGNSRLADRLDGIYTTANGQFNDRYLTGLVNTNAEQEFKEKINSCLHEFKSLSKINTKM